MSMNSSTSRPWKIVSQGWVNSMGEFVRTSPQVDIMPAWDGPGCGIKVASGLKLADAELIMAAVAAYDAAVTK